MKSPSCWLPFLFLPFAPPLTSFAEDPAGVPLQYKLPAEGLLPKDYRVTLAITAPGEPDWIISTFVNGAVRTVTKENQGKFTEHWNGWDDNYMPVPPGDYGVKGIYMPAETWDADGKLHTLEAKINGGPFGLTPKVGGDPASYRITGDPVDAGIGDIAVGPDGVAVFYWAYLENAQNNYLVDLNKPVGSGQLLRGFNSGGAAGGLHTTTDGKSVWSVSPGGKDGLHMWPIVYRADGKPFGKGKGRYRKDVTLPEGYVTGLAVAVDKDSGKNLVYIAERGKIVEAGKDRNGRPHYGESDTERVNIVRVLDGEDGTPVKTIPVEEPCAITFANGQLYALQHIQGKWFVGNPEGTGEPVELDGLESPEDLAVDSQGRFYVADPAQNHVYRFSPTGKPEKTYGKQDSQKEGHYDPLTFMAVCRVEVWKDQSGKERLLFAESEGPGRISEWSLEGKLLRDWNGL